ncbi:MAG: hypothetical protein WC618_02320 [Patescibacteria group bacterium]
MQYYHQLVTEKSWQLLQQFKKNRHFILIGGWAVFLYTGALKSKDIDLIVDYDELAKLKEKFAVIKNDRLKKYEIKIDNTDIDIYLPHYSELGLPAEEIKKHTLNHAGFIVPRIEILLILKLIAYLGRAGSPKGEKDKIDILSLLNLKQIDWQFYRTLLNNFQLKHLAAELPTMLKQTTAVKELNLKQNQLAKLKKELLPLL